MNASKKKCIYSQHDILMSGFACMFFQDPSLLQFQIRLEKKHQRHNLQTIFGVKDIPQNTQMRDVLDTVPRCLSENRSSIEENTDLAIFRAFSS
jgi:ssDNA-specific exonuclease RecJ